MKIVADSNIPLINEAFADIGSIELIPGRNINNDIIKDASILIVRSVTKVDKKLLENSNVQFVATATTGIDHIDTKYLQKHKIGFANASGSNANSVAEYVILALIHLAKIKRLKLQNLKLGIIGVGKIGSRVLNFAQILGIDCLLNDPPKKRLTKDRAYLSLNVLLKESDIVTLHVPLNMYREDNTYHLVNHEFISMMKDGAILINTSRGQVVNEKNLQADRKKLRGLILDVWKNEPFIDIDTLKITDIATPHIAGYSYDGKIQCAQMIYDSICSYFSIKKKWKVKDYIKSEKIPIDLKKSSDPIFDALVTAYPIMNDNENLRKINQFSMGKKGEYFDVLRKSYPKRREFYNFSVLCNRNENQKTLRILKELGFTVM